jgi:hypothetical protein
VCGTLALLAAFELLFIPHVYFTVSMNMAPTVVNELQLGLVGGIFCTLVLAQRQLLRAVNAKLKVRTLMDVFVVTSVWLNSYL